MRTKAVMIQEFAKTNPASFQGLEPSDPQVLQYQRERLTIEALLDIRDLFKSAWDEHQHFQSDVPDPTE